MDKEVIEAMQPTIEKMVDVISKQNQLEEIVRSIRDYCEELDRLDRDPVDN